MAFSTCSVVVVGGGGGQGKGWWNNWGQWGTYVAGRFNMTGTIFLLVEGHKNTCYLFISLCVRFNYSSSEILTVNR